MSVLNAPPRRRRSPSRFVLLVFVLSLPFWVAGAATTRQLMPRLPVSALIRGSHYDPRVAALVLTGVAVVAVWRPGTLMGAPRSLRPRARGLVRP
jgi:hypothetical protein